MKQLLTTIIVFFLGLQMGNAQVNLDECIQAGAPTCGFATCLTSPEVVNFMAPFQMPITFEPVESVVWFSPDAETQNTFQTELNALNPTLTFTEPGVYNFVALLQAQSGDFVEMPIIITLEDPNFTIPNQYIELCVDESPVLGTFSELFDVSQAYSHGYSVGIWEPGGELISSDPDFLFVTLPWSQATYHIEVSSVLNGCSFEFDFVLTGVYCNPCNNPTVCSDLIYCAQAGNDVTVDLTQWCNMQGEFSLEVSSPPANGQVTFLGNGYVQYVPNDLNSYPDVFSVQMIDEAGICHTRDVVLNATPDTPEAVDGQTMFTTCNQNVDFEVVEVPGYTYIWDGGVAEGPTYSCNVTNSTPNCSHTVYAVDENGCQSNSITFYASNGCSAMPITFDCIGTCYFICEFQDVQFIPPASSLDGNIVEWQWDLGDDWLNQQYAEQLTYPSPIVQLLGGGIVYNISVELTNEFGETELLSFPNYIQVDISLYLNESLTYCESEFPVTVTPPNADIFEWEYWAGYEAYINGPNGFNINQWNDLTFEAPESGGYWIDVISIQSGCISTYQLDITAAVTPNAPQPLSGSYTTTVCDEDFAIFEVVENPGEIYYWSNGEVGPIATCGFGGDDYCDLYVYAESADGCQSEWVTFGAYNDCPTECENPIPCTGQPSICIPSILPYTICPETCIGNGSNIQFTGVEYVSGGTITLNGNECFTFDADDINANGLYMDQALLEFTDLSTNQCYHQSYSLSIINDEVLQPTPSDGQYTVSVCDEEEAVFVLNNYAGIDYIWSNGQVGPTNTCSFNGDDMCTLTVYGQDPNGCTTSTVTFIAINDCPNNYPSPIPCETPIVCDSVYMCIYPYEFSVTPYNLFPPWNGILYEWGEWEDLSCVITEVNLNTFQVLQEPEYGFMSFDGEKFEYIVDFSANYKKDVGTLSFEDTLGNCYHLPFVFSLKLADFTQLVTGGNTIEVCDEDFALFEIETQEGYTYDWGTGSNSPVYACFFDDNSTCSATVEITDNYGCSVTKTFKAINNCFDECTSNTFCNSFDVEACFQKGKQRIQINPNISTCSNNTLLIIDLNDTAGIVEMPESTIVEVNTYWLFFGINNPTVENTTLTVTFLDIVTGECFEIEYVLTIINNEITPLTPQSFNVCESAESAVFEILDEGLDYEWNQWQTWPSNPQAGTTFTCEFGENNYCKAFVSYTDPYSCIKDSLQFISYKVPCPDDCSNPTPCAEQPLICVEGFQPYTVCPQTCLENFEFTNVLYGSSFNITPVGECLIVQAIATPFEDQILMELTNLDNGECYMQGYWVNANSEGAFSPELIGGGTTVSVCDTEEFATFEIEDMGLSYIWSNGAIGSTTICNFNGDDYCSLTLWVEDIYGCTGGPIVFEAYTTDCTLDCNGTATCSTPVEVCTEPQTSISICPFYCVSGNFIITNLQSSIGGALAINNGCFEYTPPSTAINGDVDLISIEAIEAVTNNCVSASYEISIQTNCSCTQLELAVGQDTMVQCNNPNFYLEVVDTGNEYTWPNGETGVSTTLTVQEDNVLEQYFVYSDDFTFELPKGFYLYNDVNCVWPGDCDYDGEANIYDVLQIGIAYGQQDVMRPNATNNWQEQACINWQNNFFDGTNYKHADCNGNGLVEVFDVEVVNDNYGLTHGKADLSEPTTDGVPLFIEFEQDEVDAGDMVNADIILGTDEEMAEDVYGLAFSIFYDSYLVKEGTEMIDFSNSWLGTEGDDLLTLTKIFPEYGRIDVVLVRNDQQNQSGNGSIFSASFVMIDDVEGKKQAAAEFTASISNVKMINNIEEVIETGLAIQTPKVIVNGSTSIDPTVASNITVGPNPFGNFLTIDIQDLDEEVNLKIYSITGQKVIEENVSGSKMSIETTNLPNGLYLAHLQSATLNYYIKLEKLK